MTALRARKGQGLDPRAVLAAMLLLILAIKGLQDWHRLLLAEAGLLLGVGLLGVPLSIFLWRSLWVLPFCLAALPLLMASPDAQPTIAGVMEWTITDQGVKAFATVVGQSVLCIQILLLGSALKTPRELLWGLQAVGCPARLVTIFGLCLRYLELLADDLQRLQWATSCRGVHGLGLVARVRLTGGLLGSLFIRALERAERVQVAMLCRGCSGALALGFQQQPTRGWSRADSMVLGLSLGLLGWVWLL